MDYSTRVILAAIMGGGTGFAVSYFFWGDLFTMVFLGTALALAVDTGLRTAKNYNMPVNPVLRKSHNLNSSEPSIPKEKPQKPYF